MSAIWLIILAILSAPLSLPLLATAIALIFSFGAVIISLIFAIVATVISIFVGGVAAMISGFLILTEHWPTALLFMGVGLIVTGLGVLLFPIVARVIKKTVVVSVETLGRLFHKMTKKRKRGLLNDVKNTLIAMTMIALGILLALIGYFSGVAG